jgi:membrane protease YdiL (CAAX protease family)
VSGDLRWSLARVLVATSLPAIAFIGVSAIGLPVVRGLGLAEAQATVVRGILPGLLGIITTILVERRLGGGTLRDATRRLGMGRPNGPQMAVALAGSLPIAIAYGVLFSVLDVSPRFADHLPLLVFKFVVAQGVAEELIFRGFVFRHLRPGRSFARAASLSAVVFSLVHLGNLVHGITVPVLVGVAISLSFAVILTYPAAYLFERGGNSIWGFGVLHVAIDSIDWLKAPPAPGPALAVYLVAVIASVPVVFWLGRRVRATG